jgi:hypothetical protein
MRCVFVSALFALALLTQARDASACRAIQPGGCDQWVRSNYISLVSISVAPTALLATGVGLAVVGLIPSDRPMPRALVVASLVVSSVATAANAGVALAIAINADWIGASVLGWTGPALALSAASLGVSAWAYRFRMAPVTVAPTVAPGLTTLAVGGRF